MLMRNKHGELQLVFFHWCSHAGSCSGKGVLSFAMLQPGHSCPGHCFDSIWWRDWFTAEDFTFSLLLLPVCCVLGLSFKGAEMACRSIDHILQYGELTLRREHITAWCSDVGTHWVTLSLVLWFYHMLNRLFRCTSWLQTIAPPLCNVQMGI